VNEFQKDKKRLISKSEIDKIITFKWERILTKKTLNDFSQKMIKNIEI
jgi:hypothetical protein